MTTLYHKQGTSYTIDQVRLLHPRTVIPNGADLSDMGYERITATPQPSFDAVRQAVREIDPVDGNQTWQVYPLPADVKAANEVQEAIDAREAAKAARQAMVDAITVTTEWDNVFQGDEASQDRMARAIIAMETSGVTEKEWVLADNTTATVTLDELREALALSVQAQDAVWVIDGGQS